MESYVGLCYVVSAYPNWEKAWFSDDDDDDDDNEKHLNKTVTDIIIKSIRYVIMSFSLHIIIMLPKINNELVHGKKQFILYPSWLAWLYV